MGYRIYALAKQFSPSYNFEKTLNLLLVMVYMSFVQSTDDQHPIFLEVFIVRAIAKYLRLKMCSRSVIWRKENHELVDSFFGSVRLTYSI